MEIISSSPTIEAAGKHSGIQARICSNISGLRIKLKTHVRRPMLDYIAVFLSLFPVPKKDHVVLMRPREANKRNVFPRGLDL